MTLTADTSPGAGTDVSPDEADDSAAPVRGESATRRSLRRFRRERVAMIALVTMGLVVVAAVIAPLLAPHDPLEQNLRRILEGPSTEHLLGTDQLGRDVLSRLLYAGRVSLLAAVQAVAVAVAIGVPVGLVLGYVGGWWDRVVMRFVDAVMALPGLILVIAIVAVLGSGLTNAMVALGIVFAPTFIRLTRASTLAVREELHVDAARVQGYRTSRILLRHVLPNAIAPVIIQISLALGLAMLIEAGLSFIGLGVQPPQASWGVMLAEGSAFLDQHAFLVVPPGLAITVSVLALTLVGDGIRDSLGRGVTTGHVRPRSRRRDRIRVVDETPRPAERPDGALLRVEGLTVDIHQPTGDPLRILDDVSFEVFPGEALGLLGESGCGKSMTALAVMGLLPAGGRITSGSVHLGDTDLTSRSERDMKAVRGARIGMVFQEPMAALDPVFTVGDQIGEPLRHHDGMSRRAARRRAIELLDLVGIPDPARRVDHYPHQFSGGMAQRAMIAGALACQPELLIADEPTTALDVTIQAEILELLRELQAELGMAILFVTHDLGVIADMCDRAVVMYAGQVVESGGVDELFTRPRMPYTEGLLRSLPQTTPRKGKLAAIPGAVPAPGEWPAGCRFAERCEHRDDRCGTPVPLDEVSVRHWSRCHRAGELDLEGAR